MARVLIEHTDSRMGSALAHALHDHGFAVATCSGPTPDEPCPVLHGETCSLASRADLIVSALHDHPECARVRSGLRVQHPYTPLLPDAEPATVVQDVWAVLGC